MADLKSLKVSLLSNEKLAKLSPIYIRQKNYEFLFEDKKHNTVKTSLKLLGASFLEGFYYLTILPAIYYINNLRHEAEPHFLAKDNAIDSLVSKGYNIYEVADFMHNH